MLAPLVSCNLLGQYAGSDSLEVAINGRLPSIDFSFHLTLPSRMTGNVDEVLLRVL